MSILLSQLCANTEKTYGMKLVAGAGGLDSPVRWVHMMENIEASDFIHGNELVFTTGIRQQTAELLLSFVVSLRDNGAIGLVVNTGPFIEKIPPQVTVFCERNNFPLFTLPWEARIIDVTYDFCHRIVRNEENETGIAAAFRNLIFSPEKKDGYEGVMLRNGFHNESAYTVMLMSLTETAENLVRKSADIWKNYQFSFGKLLKKSPYSVGIFVQENNLVVIRQKSSPDETAEIAKAAAKLIDEKMNISIGISSQSVGLASVSSLYSEALSALSIARLQKKTIVSYEDIGVYKLLFGVRDSEILYDFIKATLGPLFEYDEKNSTDFSATLRCYLYSDGSIQSVASVQNVHRNTINYKMKLIREILKTELHNEDKMNYMLAFRVSEMLGSN